MAATPLRHSERILVRAPNWLGDAVMATPALRALRAQHPDAWIAVEGRPQIGELLRGVPHFDAFVPDPDGRLLRRARRLRRHRFDTALLLPDSFRAAAGPFAARIRRRVGYARDPLRRALLTDPLPVPRSADGARLGIPMVERYLRIARWLGCADRGLELELAVAPEARDRIEARLSALGVETDAPLLVIAPGASFGPSKRWPAASFAAASDELARRAGLTPVVVPSPSELELARAVAETAVEPTVVLEAAGIDGLKALLARARLALCNDSGPRHIAVALGTPAVVAMGPTDPRHTAVNLERQRVLREPVHCSPCQRRTCPIDHRCMTRLAPERAVAAGLELLENPQAGRDGGRPTPAAR